MSRRKREIEAKASAWENKARAEGWVCSACGTVLNRDELDLFIGEQRFCTNCHYGANKMLDE